MLTLLPTNTSSALGLDVADTSASCCCDKVFHTPSASLLESKSCRITTCTYVTQGRLLHEASLTLYTALSSNCKQSNEHCLTSYITFEACWPSVCNTAVEPHTKAGPPELADGLCMSVAAVDSHSNAASIKGTNAKLIRPDLRTRSLLIRCHATLWSGRRLTLQQLAILAVYTTFTRGAAAH